jgi:hypothetical protein
MKYELKIYADSKEELFEVLSRSEFIPVEENSLNNKFKLSPRKHKQWTEFELNFVTEHYLSKNIRWISGKLQRPAPAVYAKLFQMYKKGLKQKHPKVKTL